MTSEQAIVMATFAAALAMFVWGRYRYDLVAMSALMTGVLAGVVPAQAAFQGFGHPAVITVAAVLVISRALQNSGFVELLVRFLEPSLKTTTLQVATGSALAAALSCVMNNVGALALMLPVTLRNAAKARRSASIVLIPLSFASLLGGMVTLIGTPTNIVISTFRQEMTGKPFAMFDFAPVGVLIALAGLAYLSLIAWRLLPCRALVDETRDDHLHFGTYSVETSIPEGSSFAGMRIREFEAQSDDKISVLALIRDGERRMAPRPIVKLKANDIVILQGYPAIIQKLADGKDLGTLGVQVDHDQAIRSDDVTLVEAVVMANSPIAGRSMRSVRMHDRYGINLLAVGRDGRPATARLKNTTFKAGDVLLLQGEALAMEQALAGLGCLILADRGLKKLPSRRQTGITVGIFAAAIAATALGWVSAPIAFTSAVIVLILSASISLNEAYSSIEWPVILLLAGLIPLGQALQSTGATALIAGQLLALSAGAPVWLVLAMIMAVSMWLSDIMPNTPAAILMAPIAAGVAAGLGTGPDAFLMAVAVGAASPFLTPIGHQSNTLVMGPGGYRFGDYFRAGVPMQVLILLVGVPAIMWFW